MGVIVGIAGFARAGKDSAANHLTEHHGFTRVAFADPLKAILYDINPTIQLSLESQELLGIDDWTLPLQYLVDRFGWELAKAVAAVREELQDLGMSARKNIYPGVWVDAAMIRADEATRCVVPDCRFVNEAQAIKDRGGYVVRVMRPGVSAVNSHISEHGLEGWGFDAVIDNSGTLEDLGDEVERVMAELGIL